MITVNTVSEYISMNEKRRSVLSVLADGMWSFYVGGEWIGEEIFDSLFPAVDFKPKRWAMGDNANKSANYLENKKSY